MADVQILREYLVKLGFDADRQSFSKFEKAVVGTEAMIAKTGSEVAKTIGGVAGAIVTAYAAIGAATVGLMDKVANQDLGYQLFAQRMYMNVNAAKHLKIATEALGHSIDEIAWNPELLERYQNLVRLQERLDKKLGPEFEGRMRGIRNFRFELTRMQVTLQYLAMGVASNVFSRLEKDVPGLQEKVSGLVDYITNNLPRIADQIGANLAPIIRNIAIDAKAVAESMMRFLGLIFDDESMRKGTLSFENMGRAVGHVVTFISTLVEEIVGLGEALIHFFKMGMYVQTFQYGKAYAEAKSMGGDIARHAKNIASFAAADVPEPTVSGGNKGPASPGGGMNNAATARSLAMQVSAKTGIPADFIFAQWAHETGGFSSRAARQQFNWGGIKSSTGVGYRSFANPQEFADFYGRLLMSKRYQSAGIGAASNTDEFAAALKRGGYYEDAYSNYSRGLRRWEPQFSGGSRIDVGGVNVHITQPNATPDQVYEATLRAVDDRMSQRAARNTTEFGGPLN